MESTGLVSFSVLRHGQTRDFLRSAKATMKTLFTSARFKARLLSRTWIHRCFHMQVLPNNWKTRFFPHGIIGKLKKAALRMDSAQEEPVAKEARFAMPLCRQRLDLMLLSRQSLDLMLLSRQRLDLRRDSQEDVHEFGNGSRFLLPLSLVHCLRASYFRLVDIKLSVGPPSFPPCSPQPLIFLFGAKARFTVSSESRHGALFHSRSWPRSSVSHCECGTAVQ